MNKLFWCAVAVSGALLITAGASRAEDNGKATSNLAAQQKVSAEAPSPGTDIRWSPDKVPSVSVQLPAGYFPPWKNGKFIDPNFFPIGVWLQTPANADKFREIGVNFFVGLWQGPTQGQLNTLKKLKMPIICEQNAVALADIKNKDSAIIAWLQPDEPDNAQALPDGKGYGPPITPDKVIKDYDKMKTADPDRPVYLGLGQGVAWDQWFGRGVRTGHPEDYLEYVKGGDIVSYDIYPAASSDAAVKNNLWYVAKGVARLKTDAAGKKTVWNVLECTSISTKNKATPSQIRAEAWMSIIQGSTGIVWFVHQWYPSFKEPGLLEDSVNMAAVAAVNREVTRLAPVINSPDITENLEVKSSNEAVPLDTMTKRYKNAIYVFSCAMRDGQTKGRFTLRGIPGKAIVEVINENRQLEVNNGTFEDTFNGYEVHLYRLWAQQGTNHSASETGL